ncbi:MAG TPA: 3-oxoacyl-ACP synthase III [Anaerolineae bacterium]|nr:3-oxoacyl-ACP synthase III [Anaerolineae bacterium]HMR62927.1 3-oxoacyl-ACP synthase III [Anaerolineae bacterium]
MLFENVRIEAVAYELGPERVSSTDLEEQFSETLARLEIRPGILESLSGIRERRFWPFGTKPSEVATLAARKAIEISGVDPQKIGCMINTSVFRDYIEPSTASLIHGNLRLPDSCLNYDLGNACLGFVNGIFNIAMMVESRMIRHGLVVAGEAGRDIIESTIQQLRREDVSKADFMENIATLTLGEGAVAMILSHRDVAHSNHRINGAVSMAATEHNRLCVASPTLMRSYPSKLLVAGASLIAKTWRLANRTLDRWTDDEIDLYAPHQVSAHNTLAVIRAIGATRSKFKLTFPWLGNTGPVGLPTALALAGEEGQVEEGDHICMMGIGSGLNCMLMSVTW